MSLRCTVRDLPLLPRITLLFCFDHRLCIYYNIYTVNAFEWNFIIFPCYSGCFENIISVEKKAFDPNVFAPNRVLNDLAHE